MRFRILIAFAGLVLALLILPNAPSYSQARGQQAQGRGQQAPAPARPAPRFSDGRPNFGPVEGESGVWLPGAASFADPDQPTRGGRGQAPIAGAPAKPKLSQVPFLDWARELYVYRQDNEFEPHTRCKPSGGAREFFTPYGVEFVDMPELKRMFIMDIGGPHSYRIIYMDGREHPKDLLPTYLGHSIGRWDGDTLSIDTVGFNERFWMDREGMPSTEKLHFMERLTRLDMNSMKYEITIDDSGAYSKPWSTGFVLRWSAGQELFEYVCQDNNHAPELMVGAQKSVDRSSVIVP
ncbi:MAG TPA: hypothetical protein VE422_04230 [Terriglobia bacterium]|nr:hypothetical protein [Terriglobia bacterium]